MSHPLTQGPGRPTRNSQQAGIAERILDFGRHRSPPTVEVPTVVQTPHPQCLQWTLKGISCSHPTLPTRKKARISLPQFKRPCSKCQAPKLSNYQPNRLVHLLPSLRLPRTTCITSTKSSWQRRSVPWLTVWPCFLSLCLLPLLRLLNRSPASSQGALTHSTDPTQESLMLSYSSALCTSYSTDRIFWTKPLRWHLCSPTSRAPHSIGSRPQLPTAHPASCPRLGCPQLQHSSTNSVASLARVTQSSMKPLSADESSASSGTEIVKTNKSDWYISLSNFVQTSIVEFLHTTSTTNLQ